MSTVLLQVGGAPMPGPVLVVAGLSAPFAVTLGSLELIHMRRYKRRP